MENRKDIKIYFGISAGNWKQRIYNHRHSFSNPSLRNQTALSKWFRRLKDSSLTLFVRWNFIKGSTIWSNFRSRYNLSLEEKISIMKYRNTCKLLNQRNELIFKCCHKKYKLMWNDFRLYIYIYIYIYIDIYICLKKQKSNNSNFIYIYIYIWICICISLSLCIYIYIYICVCVCVCVCALI